MLNSSKILFVILLANLFLFEACTTDENANTNSEQKTQTVNTESLKTNPPKDNVDELLNIIQLPELPEEVVWREETVGKNDSRVPGPTDRKIIVVLKYTAEGAAKIVALVEKNKQSEHIEIGTETWFPEELTAQAQMSGNEMLKGTAYSPNQFFNIPYGNGKITRIENTNYFVLELFTT